jgi:hypothetical protein
MGVFVQRAPVRVAVESRPEEWIEIKAKLGQADRSRLLDALVTVDGAASGQPDVALHVGQQALALLRIGVTNWCIFERDEAEQIVREADGTPRKVRFDPALVDLMDPDDELVDRALGELAQRNPISRTPQRTVGG